MAGVGALSGVYRYLCGGVCPALYGAVHLCHGCLLVRTGKRHRPDLVFTLYVFVGLCGAAGRVSAVAPGSAALDTLSVFY